MRVLQLLFVLVGVLGLALAGCSSLGEPAGEVEVRIANRSTQDFDRVSVTFPSDQVDYGALARGATSRYQQVAKAYRYAKVDVTVDGESLTLQPQDFMGETPLEPGRYTYALTLEDGSRDLKLELVED